MDDLIDKKKKILEKEFEKIQHNIDDTADIHDEEFLRKKYNKLKEKSSLDIDELADINIGDDLPVTEKKTKLENFKQ